MGACIRLYGAAREMPVMERDGAGEIIVLERGRMRGSIPSSEERVRQFSSGLPASLEVRKSRVSLAAVNPCRPQARHGMTRLAAILLAVALTGCASTRVRVIGPDGRYHTVCVIQGDGSVNFQYRDRYGSASLVGTLNHSAATLAWGTAGAAIGGAVAQDLAAYFAHLSFGKL
jgi:hypothetical protein